MSADLEAARREAEEALANHADRWPPYCACHPCNALRALLAALPPAPVAREVTTEVATSRHTPENCTDGSGGALCNRCFSKIIDAPAQSARPAMPEGAEIARLAALLNECNAVCLCGCPASEHESYGEDGESCGHDDHECIRVAPAVLAYVNGLRQVQSTADAARKAGGAS